MASPSISLSTPAMIFSSVRLARAVQAEHADLGAGEEDSEMFLRICRFGGTILPTRFMVKTY